MKYLLAHDLGTSGNKATLFSVDGQLIKSYVESYDCHYFNGNWAEQNPEDWWRAVCVTTKNILKEIDPADVAAVSFSGQMMGCVCIDKNGEVLMPSIIWADQRAVKQAEAIAQKIPARRFFETTGHRNSASYSIQKFMWIKENEPEIYANTYKMLFCKDYIGYKLTGNIATEPSDAAGAAALDINKMQWSEEILEAAGIDGAKLPEIKPSTHILGGVTAEAAALTGLKEGTPIVCGGGDGCCASVGASVIEEGSIYCTMGSSAWISYTGYEPLFDDDMKIFNWPSLVPGMVNPCGTMQAAGVSYNWMKNVLCTGEKMQAQAEGKSVYDLINGQIAQAQPGSNGLFYLPYLMGERSPRWNPNAKGAFIGLKAEHERKDVLRSVVEGISFNMNAILNIFKKERDFKEIIVIGGSAKSDVWLQILADIYDLEIQKPNYLEEATSMGAAITGGVGVGAFEDFSAIHKFLKTDAVVKPIPENVAKYKELMPVFDECYEALTGVYETLAKL